jgi:hypothetical protein
MDAPKDQELTKEGARAPILILGPHGGSPGDQELEDRGLRPIFSIKWGLKPYYNIFMDFLARFGRFNQFFEDLGPFFRPNLGGKLGFFYPLQVYIQKRFLNPWREFRTGKC